VASNLVLVIDDQHEQWAPALDPPSITHGFKLIYAESVEEGLKHLKDYPAVIDAVILDLVFPDGLQGKDALSKIKQFDPHLPVLVLTGSDNAEDVRTAVECVRLGAFDYFTKGRLDPEQLFLQAKNAIENRQLAKRHSHLSSLKPFVSVAELGEGVEQRLYAAEFAFELETVLRPRDVTEENEAQKLAVRWHYDLLNALSLFPSFVSVKLSFARVASDDKNKQPQITVFLTGQVEGTTGTEARERAASLANELGIYLSRSSGGSTVVYEFRAVESEDELRQLNRPVREKSKLQFLPRCTRATEGGILVGAHFRKDVPVDELVIPTPFHPTSLPALGHLCNILMDQSAPTTLQVSVRPTKLTPMEIDLLRHFRNQRWTEEGESTPTDYKMLYDALDDFLTNSHQCFDVNITLSYEGDHIPESLVSTVARELFGGTAGCTHEPAGHRSRGEPAEVARLPYTYPLTTLPEVFHLPLPVVGGIRGVYGSHPLFDFVPPTLSTDGPVLGVKRIGQHGMYVRLAPEDLRRHLYILGQTGTGKTTMLHSMIMERIRAGGGVGLIDPHGDLHSSIRSSIPPERQADVVVFDPADVSNPMGLNMLEYDPVHPEQKSLLTNEMISIFDMLYDLRQTGGPIFEQYMRNAMLLVMDDPLDQGTLVDVVRVFQDHEYRKGLIAYCKNELVKGFWGEAMRTKGEGGIEYISPYITSKLNQFMSNDFVYPIVSQRTTTLDFRQVIDTGKILLVKLTKGRLGDIGVKLLGMIVFAKLLLAALSREDTPEGQRKDFTLFVDEFQNFTSESVATMLAEARKYRLNLVLANQNLGQLREEILESVLGNAGSLALFRPGVKDVERLLPYVNPPFNREELLGLKNYVAVARLLVQGMPQPPFVFETVREMPE